MNQKRFSLIELLIVIAIMAILFAILLPMLTRAKYIATRSLCLNNLKQNGTAATLFGLDNRGNMPNMNRPTSTQFSAVYIRRNGVDLRPKFIKYLQAWETWKCPSVPINELPDGPNVYTSGTDVLTTYMYYGGYEGQYYKPIYANITLNTAGTPLLQDLIWEDRNKGLWKYLHEKGRSVPLMGSGAAWQAYKGPYLPRGANIVYADGHGLWENFSELQCFQPAKFAGVNKRAWSKWW